MEKNKFNDMQEKVAANLELINPILKLLGIEIKCEKNALVPYYDGKKMLGSDQRSYWLPNISMTEAVTIKYNKDKLLIMERDIWANRFVFGIIDDSSIEAEAMSPSLYLDVACVGVLKRFQVGVFPKDNEDSLMTICFADMLAIVVYKNEVKVYRGLLEDSEEVTDISYSGYDDLYIALEQAINSLVNSPLMNPDKIDMDDDKKGALFLRVIKNFLLSEAQRAINDLKQTVNKEAKGEQLVKKRNETV